MNYQKFLLATLAGTVTSLIGGFLMYGLALHNYFMENSMEGVMNPEPDWLYLILGHIVYSALVTYIFMKWAGISTWMGGLKAGALLGLLFTLGTGLLYFATSNMYSGGITTVLADTLAGTVVWALGGLGVGAVLGMGKAKAES